MTHTKQSKEYKTPQFQLVGKDESNRVFFAASGPTPGLTTASGNLSNIGCWY